MASALLERFPGLCERLPYRSLGCFPTAIERVHGLVSSRVEVFIKREDRAAALYGGNKVRKLEHLLGEAPGEPRAAAGVPRRLIAYGTYGSNYTLATGLFGRALGYEVAAVLYPQPLTALVRDRLYEQLGAGVRLWVCPSYLQVPLLRRRARRELAGPAPQPLIETAPGGSSPLGTLGWVSGGLEIAAQVAAGEAPRFDAVYAALGSGGMVAGLWLGLGEAAAELVAVRVVPWPIASRTTVRWLAGRTASLLRSLHQGVPPPLPPRPQLRLDGRWVGGGYAHPTAAGLGAMARAAAVGVQLEPTYTGKTLAALLADADAGRLDGKRVLFIHSYNSVDLAPLRAQGAAHPLPDWLRRRLEAARLEPAPAAGLLSR
jgi:D-cysteine desulfhydrase